MFHIGVIIHVPWPLEVWACHSNLRLKFPYSYSPVIHIGISQYCVGLIVTLTLMSCILAVCGPYHQPNHYQYPPYPSTTNSSLRRPDCDCMLYRLPAYLMYCIYKSTTKYNVSLGFSQCGYYTVHYETKSYIYSIYPSRLPL